MHKVTVKDIASDMILINNSSKWGITGGGICEEGGKVIERRGWGAEVKMWREGGIGGLLGEGTRGRSARSCE